MARAILAGSCWAAGRTQEAITLLEAGLAESGGGWAPSTSAITIRGT